jgi:hypothetical protein
MTIRGRPSDVRSTAEKLANRRKVNDRWRRINENQDIIANSLGVENFGPHQLAKPLQSVIWNNYPLP